MKNIYIHLSKEEEYELIKKVQAGDKTAMNPLLNSMVGTIVKIAKKYDKNGCFSCADEMISVGYFGLDEAVMKFDFSRDNRLSTVASIYIANAILDSMINEGNTIRLPKAFYDNVRKVKKAIRELEKKGIFGASCYEIAEICGLSEEIVRNVNIYNPSYEYEGWIGDGDEGYSSFDSISSTDLNIEETVVSEEEKELIRKEYYRLSPVQQDIVSSYLFHDESFTDIAKRLGCSVQNIHQVYNRIIGSLKKRYNYAIGA